MDTIYVLLPAEGLATWGVAQTTAASYPLTAGLPIGQELFKLELHTMASSDLDLIVVRLPDPEGSPGP